LVQESAETSARLNKLKRDSSRAKLRACIYATLSRSYPAQPSEVLG